MPRRPGTPRRWRAAGADAAAPPGVVTTTLIDASDRPRPELDARIKALYVEGMEAFTAGDYRKALKSWEQILVIDPLNENARRNVLEARDRLKAEARR